MFSFFLVEFKLVYMEGQLIGSNWWFLVSATWIRFPQLTAVHSVLIITFIFWRSKFCLFLFCHALLILLSQSGVRFLNPPFLFLGVVERDRSYLFWGFWFVKLLKICNNLFSVFFIFSCYLLFGVVITIIFQFPLMMVTQVWCCADWKYW